MLILLFKNRKDFSDSRYKLELNSKNAILRTRNLIYHEIIEVLLKNGANANARMADLGTPLHPAAMNSKYQI